MEEGGNQSLHMMIVSLVYKLKKIVSKFVPCIYASRVNNFRTVSFWSLTLDVAKRSDDMIEIKGLMIL